MSLFTIRNAVNALFLVATLYSLVFRALSPDPARFDAGGVELTVSDCHPRHAP